MATDLVLKFFGTRKLSRSWLERVLQKWGEPYQINKFPGFQIMMIEIGLTVVLIDQSKYSSNFKIKASCVIGPLER